MILILIVVSCAIFIGLLFIIFSGTFYIKKDQVGVFEKLYKFYVVRNHGLHMMAPFITRCVGRYPSSIQRIKFSLEKYDVYIVYQIEDFKSYHYNGHNFKEYLLENLKSIEEKDIEDYIKKEAIPYGIQIQEIKIKNKD